MPCYFYLLAYILLFSHFGYYFNKRLLYMDVKSRNGEKFEIFSNFLVHPVETPWPILTVLHQTVRRSPYILNHIWQH